MVYVDTINLCKILSFKFCIIFCFVYDFDDIVVPIKINFRTLKIIFKLFYVLRTLEERAQRLFLTKGRRIEDLDPDLLAKEKQGKANKAR